MKKTSLMESLKTGQTRSCYRTTFLQQLEKSLDITNHAAKQKPKDLSFPDLSKQLTENTGML